LSYTINIGAAPANAHCAQLSQTSDFERVNRFEIDAYRIGIIAIHGRRASLLDRGCDCVPLEYDGNVATIPRPELDEVTIGALLTTRPGANGHFATPVFETIHTNLSTAFPKLAEAARARLAGDVGVCGRVRNPTLRIWPEIFADEADMLPVQR